MESQLVNKSSTWPTDMREVDEILLLILSPIDDIISYQAMDISGPIRSINWVISIILLAGR